MENSNIFTNILTDCTNQFGLDHIVNVSTSGTGAVDVSPRNIHREEIWLDDLADPMNILLQTHLLESILGMVYGRRNIHLGHLDLYDYQSNQPQQNREYSLV